MKLTGIKDNCSRVDDIAGELSLKIKCRRGNCAEWCQTFADCLKQSLEWPKKCARKFKKLFRGHRRTKIKVNAVGNQSSYNIDVTFCGWKRRYKVYTIESFEGVSEANGMYKVPSVLNMRSFLIKNFINLFIHKSIRPSDLSIAPSLFRSQSVIYQSRVFLTHQFTYSFIYFFFFIAPSFIQINKPSFGTMMSATYMSFLHRWSARRGKLTQRGTLFMFLKKHIYRF